MAGSAQCRGSSHESSRQSGGPIKKGNVCTAIIENMVVYMRGDKEFVCVVLFCFGLLADRDTENNFSKILYVGNRRSNELCNQRKHSIAGSKNLNCHWMMYLRIKALNPIAQLIYGRFRPEKKQVSPRFPQRKTLSWDVNAFLKICAMQNKMS